MQTMGVTSRDMNFVLPASPATAQISSGSLAPAPILLAPVLASTGQTCLYHGTSCLNALMNRSRLAEPTRSTVESR